MTDRKQPSLTLWKVMLKELHRLGGGPQPFKRFCELAGYSDLKRARTLGLLEPAGHGLWKLTALGEDWCEGRAFEEAAPNTGAGRAKVIVVRTVPLAPLPKGITSTVHLMDDGTVPRLTPREHEVLTLLGKGLTNAEIAELLGLVEYTVADFIKAIYAKLGVSRRVEAAVWAAKAGML